jgi:hypothetical protein
VCQRTRPCLLALGWTVLGLALSQACGGDTRHGNLFPCVDDVPAVAGYVRCKNGIMHRVAKLDCPSPLPRSTVFGSNGPSSIPAPASCAQGIACNCHRDTDCAGLHGYCNNITPPGGELQPDGQCAWGCVRDEECMIHEICLCGDPIGRCVPSSCTTDAQCASGFACASYPPGRGCPREDFGCQDPTDECAIEADCGAGKECVVESGRRVCRPGYCVVTDGS